jgi:hypothetical protein
MRLWVKRINLVEIEGNNMRNTKSKSQNEVLKGWAEIAKFLGQTVAVAQRWGRSGMPVTHSGRAVHAVPEELSNWVGTAPVSAETATTGNEQVEPIRIASEGEDLAADLKRGLLYVCEQKKKRKA